MTPGLCVEEISPLKPSQFSPLPHYQYPKPPLLIIFLLFFLEARILHDKLLPHQAKYMGEIEVWLAKSSQNFKAFVANYFA